MSVILVDLGNEQRDCMINNMGWRDTVALMRSLGLFDEDRLELLETAWLGQELTQDEARVLGNALVAGPLAAFNWCDNVYPPDEFWADPGKYRHVEYAAETYWPSWLRALASLCLTCKGFVVY
jgi:hypothetical protein